MGTRDFSGDTMWDEEATVTLGAELASGNEGAVHAIQGSGDAVAKVFWSEKRGEKEDKIRAMLQNPPPAPAVQRTGTASLIWPEKMLYESQNGAFMGYRMPRLDTQAYTPADAYARNELAWDDSTLEDRYRPAVNLAMVVSTLHRQNHAIGDMNHENILVNGGDIAVVDCDSFHITGTNNEYPDTTSFHRYAPVEGRGSNLRVVQRADRFGLAIHIFQFVMEGQHPYPAVGKKSTGGTVQKMIEQNRFPYHNPNPGVLEPPDDVPPYEDLPQAVRDLFERCFTAGKRQAGHRPTAHEWVQTLLDESGLEDELTDLDAAASSGTRRWDDSNATSGEAQEGSDRTQTESARFSESAHWRSRATGRDTDRGSDESSIRVNDGGTQSRSRAVSDHSGHHASPQSADDWRDRAKNDGGVLERGSADTGNMGRVIYEVLVAMTVLLVLCVLAVAVISI